MAKKIDVTIIFNAGEKISTSVEPGTKLSVVANELQSKCQYKILAAQIKNKVYELTRTIEKSCEIIFLDIRDTSAARIYERSVSFIYIKAVYDLFGAETKIQNSIQKGLFAEIEGMDEVSEETAESIRNRMKEIIKEDLPFARYIMTRDEAFEMLEIQNMPIKTRMLESVPFVKKVSFYVCDNCVDFFYGIMVPSSGYIQQFELTPYENGLILKFPTSGNPDAPPKEGHSEQMLFEAFREADRWGKLLDISYLADLNDKIVNDRFRGVMQVAEALHEKKIANIADIIVDGKKRIVLIAGPSSSGKTTFARRLCVQLRVNGANPIYMGTDDYFVEREETPKDCDGKYNFEDIEALDLKLFNDDINALLDGKEVDMPTFDFLEGKKKFGDRMTKLNPEDILVIEGIHGLNGKLTAQIDDDVKFKIYISPLTPLGLDSHNRIPTTDTRLIRRIVRDNQYRGQNAQGTIASWPSVRRGEDKNIFPFNSEADVFFNSSLIYEISVLKKYVEPLLKAIEPDCEEYAEAVRLLKFIQFFETVEDNNDILNNSIIKEFIGGSIFLHD